MENLHKKNTLMNKVAFALNHLNLEYLYEIKALGLDDCEKGLVDAAEIAIQTCFLIEKQTSQKDSPKNKGGVTYELKNWAKVESRIDPSNFKFISSVTENGIEIRPLNDESEGLIPWDAEICISTDDKIRLHGMTHPSGCGYRSTVDFPRDKVESELGFSFTTIENISETEHGILMNIIKDLNLKCEVVL